MDWNTVDVNQVWHEWLNKLPHHDHAKYEFKSMLGELARLPHLFRAQREGTLPKRHKQCSLSPAIPIKNELTCCLGKKVLDCDILRSLWEYFSLRRQHYTEIKDTDVDGVMAVTCCQHILAEATTEGKMVDTSEGYILTTSDRMFWDNVYENMRG